MLQSYSSLSKTDISKEIARIREAGKKIASTPATARAFLIKAGIASKNGKQLAPRYR
jgi:hypothetical protein